MKLYTCSVCGRISPGRQCPEHTHDRSGPGANAQARFREAVLARDDYKCRRCGSKDNLVAAHWPIPYRAFAKDDPEAFDPKHGLTMCDTCHVRQDPYARPLHARARRTK